MQPVKEDQDAISQRPPVPGLPTSDQRDRVTAELCEHFAVGHIGLDVLEQRLAVVDEARSLAELETLVGDLPVLAAVAAPVAELPAERGWALAVLGGRSRKGEWRPPRQLNAVAVMGGVELDFRDALLAEGATRVTAVAVMGGIKILVPPGLPVTVRGMGIMGAVEDHVEQPGGSRASEAPHLVVTALACMGGVEIKTRASKRIEELATKRKELRR
ncbi:MAG: DUF1707 and DUF2154 domain-containing protein [Gemmatimonadota bacterium]|nr:MAG: DUF1707 and DUF2154 domain-containing protein [Gemmatimonadota bacterium]